MWGPVLFYPFGTASIRIKCTLNAPYSSGSHRQNRTNPKKRGKIIACGTTTLRALESASDQKGNLTAGDYETIIFIRPGYRFRVVDRLITNFHLPKTTLMLILPAGYDAIKQAYQPSHQTGIPIFPLWRCHAVGETR